MTKIPVGVQAAPDISFFCGPMGCEVVIKTLAEQELTSKARELVEKEMRAERETTGRWWEMDRQIDRQIELEAALAATGILAPPVEVTREAEIRRLRDLLEVKGWCPDCGLVNVPDHHLVCRKCVKEDIE